MCCGTTLAGSFSRTVAGTCDRPVCRPQTQKDAWPGRPSSVAAIVGKDPGGQGSVAAEIRLLLVPVPIAR